MAGGSGIEQKLQALAQLQPEIYQQAQGLSSQGMPGLLGHFAGNSAPPASTAQLYQDWTNSLLQPYRRMYSAPPQNQGLPQNQLAMMLAAMRDPNMTPSGGGH